MSTEIAGHRDFHSDIELAINHVVLISSGADYCYRLVLRAILIEHEESAVGELLSVTHVVLKPFLERCQRLVSKRAFKGRRRDSRRAFDLGDVGSGKDKWSYGSFAGLFKEPIDVVVGALKEEVNGL